MKMRPHWRTALQAALLAEGEAEDVLRGIVRELDLPLEEGPGLHDVALARALLASGPALEEAVAGNANIQATLRAAAAFVAAPSDETMDAYVQAATDSYPFGPGDGCHSILPPDQPHDAPGSGCRSGSGTLLSIGYTAGMARVLAEVRAALLPWLEGFTDG